MPSFCDKINSSFCFSPNFSTQILKMLVIFEMINVQFTFGSVSKMMVRGSWKHSAWGLTARTTKCMINSLSGNQSYFSIFKDWIFGDWLDRQSPITNQQSVKSSDWFSMPLCGESGIFRQHLRLHFSNGTFLFSQCNFNLVCRIQNDPMVYKPDSFDLKIIYKEKV